MQESTIKLMGVLNVTPDSFSDGGLYASADAAVAQAENLIAQGVDILDLGGESTRPYADPVGVGEELRRVIPVIEKIRENHDIPISIDTMKAEVALAALQAGATMINDVSALEADPMMLQVVKESEVPVVLMHMQGTPQTMQLAPSYGDVVAEIKSYFKAKLAWLEQEGVDSKRLILDPGIGFGKTLEHNLAILKNLHSFTELGPPLLLAHSRKRFLKEITGIENERERDLATAVVAALCSNSGVSIIRVHDVAATRQALAVAAALTK